MDATLNRFVVVLVLLCTTASVQNTYGCARMLEPGMGRFLQRDPAEYVDSGNLYQYERTSPGNNVDPTGWAPILWQPPSQNYGNSDQQTDIVYVSAFGDSNDLSELQMQGSNFIAYQQWKESQIKKMQQQHRRNLMIRLASQINNLLRPAQTDCGSVLGNYMYNMDRYLHDNPMNAIPPAAPGGDLADAGLDLETADEWLNVYNTMVSVNDGLTPVALKTVYINPNGVEVEGSLNEFTGFVGELNGVIGELGTGVSLTNEIMNYDKNKGGLGKTMFGVRLAGDLSSDVPLIGITNGLASMTASGIELRAEALGQQAGSAEDAQCCEKVRQRMENLAQSFWQLHDENTNSP